MPRELTEREKWLRERVQKVVFRPETGCTCDTCLGVYLHGLYISDENHADYLAEMEVAYSHDGIPMQYFDTREEALEFEKNNPPSQSLKDKQ